MRESVGKRELRSQVTKAKLLFSLSIQSTPVQSIATLPVPKAHKNQVTKAKLLFNLSPQNIPAQSVPMERKRLVTKARL